MLQQQFSTQQSICNVEHQALEHRWPDMEMIGSIKVQQKNLNSVNQIKSYPPQWPDHFIEVSGLCMHGIGGEDNGRTYW